jgi:hypothetical protein
VVEPADHPGAGRTSYWVEEGRVARASGIHLLPAFDEYLVAYRHRDAMLDPAHTARVNNGGGLLAPIVIDAGLVIGLWRRTLSRGSVALEIDLFAPPGQARTRAIAAAAKRYVSSLDLPLGRVDVRSIPGPYAERGKASSARDRRTAPGRARSPS